MTLKNKTILITGASSYVGSRIYYDLQDRYNLIGTYFSNPISKILTKLDLSDNQAIKNFISQTKPDIIIHTANYASSRDAIDNQEVFTKLNLDSTQSLTEVADKVGAKFIFISSQAASNPSNIYGEYKYKSEQIVQSGNSDYLILRPSMIVGLSPNTTKTNPFNRILSCLKNHQVEEFDTSWKIQPAYIGHLAHLIDRSIQDDRWDITIPVFIDELVTQHQIATDILRPFGININKIDKKLTIPPSTDDLTYFNSLNLQPKTYQDMVEVIIEEIRQGETYKI